MVGWLPGKIRIARLVVPGNSAVPPFPREPLSDNRICFPPIESGGQGGEIRRENYVSEGTRQLMYATFKKAPVSGAPLQMEIERPVGGFGKLAY